MRKETLEEAKIKHTKFCIENNIENPPFSFDKGAKWQQEQFKNESTADYIDRHIVEALVETAKQERSYSEEEVLELLTKAHFVEQNIVEWFEQFSKLKNG
jgi:hypothetical protein